MCRQLIHEVKTTQQKKKKINPPLEVENFYTPPSKLPNKYLERH